LLTNTMSASAGVFLHIFSVTGLASGGLAALMSIHSQRSEYKEGITPFPITPATI